MKRRNKYGDPRFLIKEWNVRPQFCVLKRIGGNHIHIVMPIRIRHCDKKGASQQKNLS